MKRHVPYLALAYLIVAGALAWAHWSIYTVTSDTNKRVKVEIAERDAQIAAQTYVINQQAVPAITYMLKEFRAAGLTPPTVLLSPNEPPFKPPPRNP